MTRDKTIPDLFKHQQEAIVKAIQLGGNMALFHDPGCGKTRTSLEIFKHLRYKNPHLKLLVVCPLSLVNSAWGKDIQTFTDFSWIPLKDLKAVRDVLNIPDIVIINYEAIISAKYLNLAQTLLKTHEFMCVLDESSRLKSHNSVTTKLLLKLEPLYRIIATGTASPNSEMELWGQIRFISPELLPKSFYAYKNTYFHLQRKDEVMQGVCLNRQAMRKIFMSGWKYAISEDNRKKLMNKIGPVIHWVKKSEALDLPDKVDQIREVALNDKEQRAYHEMLKDLVTEIQGTQVAAQVAMTKTIKLRQVTSGFMYDETGKALVIGKSKLNELENVLEELRDQPVIIWAQFTYEIHAINEMIAKKHGADQVVILSGETKDKDDSITRFQNNQAQYLIAHPKSAAHGLTFINCHTMVFFSWDYSYESHAQGRDRIHRIGQKNNCLYIYLMATGKNVVQDEEMLNVLQGKKQVQDAIYALIKSQK